MKTTIDTIAEKMNLTQEQTRELLQACHIPCREDSVEKCDLERLETCLRQMTRAEQMLQKAVIIPAPCVMQKPGFARLMQRLPQGSKPVQILGEAMTELRTRKEDDGAAAALALAERLKADGTAEISEDGGCPFDCAAQEYIYWLPEDAILLLTDDWNLFQDVYHDLPIGKEMMAMDLDDRGQMKPLEMPSEEDDLTLGKVLLDEEVLTQLPALPEVTPAPELEKADGRDPETAHRLPETGDLVLEDKKIWKLGKFLGARKNGVIYDLGDGEAAKLLYPDLSSVSAYSHIVQMANHPLEVPGVCWPQALLENVRGELIGYRMKKATGVDLMRCCLTEEGMEANFPQWTRQDVAVLCKTVLQLMIDLQQQGVVVKNYDDLKLLVEAPDRVWLENCEALERKEDYHVDHIHDVGNWY